MQQPAQEQSVVDTIKNWVDTQSIPGSQEAKQQWVEVGFYLAVGFVSGFLFKKYGHVFFLFILFGLGLLGLDHFGFLHIQLDWAVIEQLTGIKQASVAGGGLPLFFEWVRLNIWIVISFVIGVIFGFKVG